jgi:hypothetical protein
MFTGDGGFIATWGTGGSGNGQFQEPAGLALNAATSLYVADRANDRIEKFTP